MADRILALEGVNNFRDYGGYRSCHGGTVRRGVLWRSAQHGDATEADLAAIDRLGLARVVDLRGPSEREEKPCRRGDGFAAEVWSYPEETAGLALHTEAADGILTADEARAAMVGLYQGIAYRVNLVPMLRVYFELLGRDTSPSLVHCVAGKDRTGWAVAIAQHALGVHHDDIMADYLATNSAARVEQRIAAGVFAASPRYGRLGPDAIRALWGVDERYLQTALDAVLARSGSLDGYLEDVIGLDAAKRESLRALYLEP